MRLGMLAILVIAVGFVAYYFVALEQCHAVTTVYNGLQDDWARIDPKCKAAKARQDELDEEIKASDQLKKSVDNRFYLAPVLGEILRTVPQNDQLLHISLDAPADEEATGSVLSVSGISSAGEPRKEAEAVRTALEARLATGYKKVTSVFKALDDSDQVVTFNGHTLATATFTIEFQIQVRDPVVVAPPPVRKQRIAAE